MRQIVLILGTTASGKTSLAIELANQLSEGGECICADSMQVYQRMDIGTAKPTKQEQATAPHHLLNIAIFFFAIIIQHIFSIKWTYNRF